MVGLAPKFIYPERSRRVQRLPDRFRRRAAMARQASSQNSPYHSECIRISKTEKIHESKRKKKYVRDTIPTSKICKKHLLRFQIERKCSKNTFDSVLPERKEFLKNGWQK